MAKEFIYKSGQIQISALAVDGGVGSAWEQLADTFKDSAKLTQGDPTDTEFNVEEQEDPIVVISEKGKTTIEMTIVDCTPATLVKVLGGKVNADGDYEAPATLPEIEKSIRFIPGVGRAVVLTRVKLNGGIDWTYSRKGMLQVKIKGTMLTPLKAQEPPMRLVNVRRIESFVVGAVSGVIDEAAKTIAIELPFGSSLSSVTPTIAHTGLSVSPASGAAQDFTNPVVYTVTACPEVTQAYTVTATVAES